MAESSQHSKAVGILHVGLPKTGSTALQHFVFARHPDIAYFSVASNGSSLPDQPEWDAFFDRVVTQDELFFEYKKEKEWVDRRICEREASDKVPLVSLEGFSEHRGIGVGQKIKRLAYLFPGYRILMVIRHPMDLIYAQYVQHINNLHRRPFQDYPLALDKFVCDAIRRPEHPLSPVSSLHFARMANGYSEYFGRDNVEVLLYEDFKYDPERFLRWLSSFSGVSEENSLDCYRTNNQRVNSRRSLEQVLYIQLYRNRIGRKIPKRLRYATAKLLTWAPTARRYFQDCAPEYVDEINALTGPECSEVASRWGLEMWKYSYPGLTGEQGSEW